MMPKAKMTIIDQDKILTDSLLTLNRLNAFDRIEVVEAYNDASNFFDKHGDLHGFVVFDLNTKGLPWKRFMAETKERFPKEKLVVLSRYEESDYVKQAFIEGVDGYISKKEDLKGLEKAFEAILEGEKYLSSHLSISPRLYGAGTVKQTEETQVPDSFEIRQKLSSREIEILTGIVNANSTKEIADQLFISEQTVAVHKKNIMKKLKVNNTIGLIKTAFENGLIEN